MQEALRIAYGDDPEQFGMLFLPAGAGPHPLVINIHGGYWRARYNHSISTELCADLARRGIAAWNLEYRRVGNPGGGWPGTFTDIMDGIEYARELAADHPLAKDRVVVMGHSAGGHLALWAAASARVMAEIAPAPFPLRAIIALAPVADLQLAWEWHLSNDAVVELLGGTPDEVPDIYALASPPALLPLGIPMTILHGTADDAVPFAIAERFTERARSAGDAVTFIAQPGADHFALVTPGTPQWEQVVAEVARWQA